MLSLVLFIIYGIYHAQTLTFDDVVIANPQNFMKLQRAQLFKVIEEKHTCYVDSILIGSSSYIALPRPYQGYIFKRINTPYTGYIDDHVPVLNVSDFMINNPTYTFYQNSVISQPNVIFTTGEDLSFFKSYNKFFYLTKLYMTSIFINNMEVTITGYRNGRIIEARTINLIVSTPSEVILNLKNVDTVVIGCTNPEPSTCAHIAYDNIQL